MSDEQHQDDPTTGMSIDQKITPNTQSAPPTFDISQPVVPGHDMVVNHLDGAQELATGNEAVAVAAAEAEKGENVPVSDVQPQPEESNHRSMPDPETNQPNPAAPNAAQQAAAPAPVEEAAAEVEAAPEEPETEDVPEAPKEGSKTPSEPSSDDVKDV